jgi:hypothetical protein
MVAKIAKELVETFRLLQSFSNPGKGRMRGIKQMSSSDQVSQMKPPITLAKCFHLPLCFFLECVFLEEQPSFGLIHAESRPDDPI